MLGIGIILVGVATFIFALTSQRISGAMALVAYVFAIGTTVYGLQMGMKLNPKNELLLTCIILVSILVPSALWVMVSRKPIDSLCGWLASGSLLLSTHLATSFSLSYFAWLFEPLPERSIVGNPDAHLETMYWVGPVSLVLAVFNWAGLKSEQAKAN